MKIKKVIAVVTALSMMLVSSLTALASEEETVITAERMAEAQAELDALVPDEVMARMKLKSEGGSARSYTISEYDVLSELSEKTEGELKTAGYDDSEIRDIKNYQEVYDEQIRTLSLLEEDVLKSFNYTDEQIDTIKNYQGTEAEMARASANCVVSVDVDRC